jgi:hypothetical protein
MSRLLAIPYDIPLEHQDAHATLTEMELDMNDTYQQFRRQLRGIYTQLTQIHNLQFTDESRAQDLRTANNILRNAQAQMFQERNEEANYYGLIMREIYDVRNSLNAPRRN